MAVCWCEPTCLFCIVQDQGNSAPLTAHPKGLLGRIHIRNWFRGYFEARSRLGALSHPGALPDKLLLCGSNFAVRENNVSRENRVRRCKWEGLFFTSNELATSSGCSPAFSLKIAGLGPAPISQNAVFSVMFLVYWWKYILILLEPQE